MYILFVLPKYKSATIVAFPCKRRLLPIAIADWKFANKGLTIAISINLPLRSFVF